MAIREFTFKSHKVSISYEIFNGGMERDIIFLHGWGSSKEALSNNFKSSFKAYRHIYIDLLGFGDSSEPPFPMTTQLYRDVIAEFLKIIDSSIDVVVGHSFGGKVATLLNPETLILLSSAGIVPKKSLTVKAKIAIYKLFKRVGLSALRDIFVSSDGRKLSHNMYETFKIVVNENFEELFKNRSGETYIFWGEDDRATPLSSGEKIHQLIKNSHFYIFEGSHFFFIGKGSQIEHLSTTLQKPLQVDSF